MILRSYKLQRPGLEMGRSRKGMPMSALVSRNVRVDGHRTSVGLEPDMWEALGERSAAVRE